jgi:cell division septum initiation protein DivIVA
VPIKPEQVNASKLPTGLRGYDRDATDELLRRVAWDYLQVERAHVTAVEEADALRQRVDELEAELVSQREHLDLELRERTAQLETEAEKLRRTVHLHEQRDEMTRRLLDSAQRSAREMRESARSECEALLKSAQRRAAEIEVEARTSLRHSLREVDRLRKLERDLKEQLRTMLEAVIGTGSPADATQEPAPPAPAEAQALPPTAVQ